MTINELITVESCECLSIEIHDEQLLTIELSTVTQNFLLIDFTKPLIAYIAVRKLDFSLAQHP